MKVDIVGILILVSAAAVLFNFHQILTSNKGERGYGWNTITCFNEGVVGHTDKWNYCPTFAGKGYSRLASGEIINGECHCTTSDR